jgi:ABC-type microcin C transport system duplicated ATPase subunit YejF
MRTADVPLSGRGISELLSAEIQQVFSTLRYTLKPRFRAVIDKNLRIHKLSIWSMCKSKQKICTITSAPLSHISLMRVLRACAFGRAESINADRAMVLHPIVLFIMSDSCHLFCHDTLKEP